MPEAVDLWTTVFGVGKPFFTSLLEGGGTGDNVSLAAIEGGRIVSSVHVFMRRIRDREGRPQKVGGIGSVSTHPDYRKRGHSGRLLTMAMESMEREGCVWSLLGTGVNDHYALYGWRTVSTPEPWGALRADTAGQAARLVPDDATLAEMAPLYDATSATRPMATVRSERTWRTAVRYRLNPADPFLFGAYEGDRLSAYLVVRVSSDGSSADFVEASGSPERLPSLFGAAAQALRAKGIERVTSALPEGRESEAFAGVVDAVRRAESRGAMLRPIADRISWPDLFALYGDPRGRHCDLDTF